MEKRVSISAIQSQLMERVRRGTMTVTQARDVISDMVHRGEVGIQVEAPEKTESKGAESEKKEN
jgi:polyhydroxyalkanoate synthesis regulator phasin